MNESVSVLGFQMHTWVYLAIVVAAFIFYDHIHGAFDFVLSAAGNMLKKLYGMVAGGTKSEAVVDNDIDSAVNSVQNLAAWCVKTRKASSDSLQRVMDVYAELKKVADEPSNSEAK